MKNKRSILSVWSVVVALGLLSVAYAASDWLKGTTEEKLRTLASIQPGLGTVMMEYSNRYSTMYYAAKESNWDLAAYQLKEAMEIQEVGETTRPGRAAALKEFEQGYLEPVHAAIKAKDWNKFEAAWNEGVKGCNFCHEGQGYGFIVYQRPQAPPSPLLMRK